MVPLESRPRQSPASGYARYRSSGGSAEQGLTNTSRRPKLLRQRRRKNRTAPAPPRRSLRRETFAPAACDRQGSFRFSSLTRFLRGISEERVPSARFEWWAPIRVDKSDLSSGLTSPIWVISANSGRIASSRRLFLGTVKKGRNRLRHAAPIAADRVLIFGQTG